MFSFGQHGSTQTWHQPITKINRLCEQMNAVQRKAVNVILHGSAADDENHAPPSQRDATIQGAIVAFTTFRLYL
jgi:hypothetical protein